jgi:sulfate/thiosulfate transport system ATP-binding protein
MSIFVKNVSKNFGNFKALENINLDVNEGKLVALLGPSGSGKSTLLRAIAGLEPPDQGTIIINGKDTTNLDIRRRNIGFVFQHYALFKHLTVKQNIAFGLEIRKVDPQVVKDRVGELLELIQLEGLGNRYPSQLSGGQRQRVALARALAVQPEVLLLDEPFGALDAKVRKELRTWLRRLHEQVHLTSVFVTHDQEEAMEVADEIVVMNKGKIEQIGTSAEIYDRPATPFVMSFIGEVNVLPPNHNLSRNYLNGLNGNNHNSELTDLKSQVFVRPHDLEIQVNPNGTTTPAIVKRLVNVGREVQAELEFADQYSVMVNVTRERFDELDLKTDQEVYVKPKTAILFYDI